MTRYKDTWKRKMTPFHMTAYRKMIDDGKIKIHHITFFKTTGVTIVEYSSEMPHKQILDEMGALVREMM